MSQSLRLSEHMSVPPEQVYFALTNGSAIQAWMGNDVRSDPRPGGRFYVWWQEGYYTAGEYVELEENQHVKLTWQGKGEPAPSTVIMTLNPVGDGTELIVEHTDLGSGADWDTARTMLSQGWENGLANLKSNLEDGVSVQIKNRPLMGIGGGTPLTEALAQQQSIPVHEGLQLTGVLADFGAANCGMQDNDVVVSISGAAVKDFQSLQAAVAPHKAGDTVSVTFYRGPDRHEVELTFSEQPILPKPESGQQIADQVQAAYAQMMRELRALFADCDEASAAYQPAEGEWSANDVISHLIQVELWAHMALNMGIQGLPGTGYGGNWNPWIDATGSIREGTAELLDEYEKQCRVSVSMLTELPQEFLARHYAYNGLGQMFALGLPNHTRSHFSQIEAALKAGKAAAVPAD